MDLAKSLILEWQNAIFSASIVFWMIYLFVSLMGSGGGDDALSGHAVDKDMDVHHVDKDLDMHHGGGHGGHSFPGASLLTYLGIGRCPISIVLMILGVTWGFVGLVLNGMFGKLWIVPPVLYFWVSAVGALIVAVPFTSVVSRVVAKIMPRRGTTAIQLDSLVGKSGEASVSIDASFGRARVCDEYGTMHNIYCRTNLGDDPVPTNAAIIVLNRLDGGRFVVKKKPKIITQE